MPSLPRSILAGLVLGALAALPPGFAQQRSVMPGMNMQETKSAAPYYPGLGELMTAFVQPRHIKLGLAGQAENWDYAAYELGELRETFEDVGNLVPKHGNLAIPPAIASTVTPAMAALDAAIKAKDPAAFTKAYAELTAGCNACHQSADHPMIVIQVPTVSVFSDQDFRPRKP
jgi:hypothetical protein